jgi:hypothetical protein
VDSQGKGKACSTTTFSKKRETYIYINKDGNPSTKGTRHIDANVNT